MRKSKPPNTVMIGKFQYQYLSLDSSRRKSKLDLCKLQRRIDLLNVKNHVRYRSLLYLKSYLRRQIFTQLLIPFIFVQVKKGLLIPSNIYEEARCRNILPIAKKQREMQGIIIFAIIPHMWSRRKPSVSSPHTTRSCRRYLTKPATAVLKVGSAECVRSCLRTWPQCENICQAALQNLNRNRMNRNFLTSGTGTGTGTGTVTC